MLLILIAGRGSSMPRPVIVESTIINQPPHAMSARPPASVAIFTSGAPKRPHADIAVVEGEGYRGTAALIHTVVDRAAVLGCDAIVQTSLDYDRGYEHLIATCIVYTDAPVPVAVDP